MRILKVISTVLMMLVTCICLIFVVSMIIKKVEGTTTPLYFRYCIETENNTYYLMDSFEIRNKLIKYRTEKKTYYIPLYQVERIWEKGDSNLTEIIKNEL